MAEGKAQIVEREDVHVMFLRTEDTQTAIEHGWARLESLVELRGRKFYGAFNAETREYWVCAELREGDEARSLGLEVGMLPGGRYLRTRLRGEPPAVYGRIPVTFQAMASATAPDRTRPSIEFYRQRDEIDCLLPIHGD